jgi:tetratricopeptide (TPR) repeat protein
MRLHRLLPCLLLAVTGCATTPPVVSPRAMENNDLCVHYMSAGDLDRADIHCDLGLQFAPGYAELWVNKGLVHYRRGQLDKAKDCYIKAIRLNPDIVHAHNNLGLIYRDQKELGRAADSFLQAVRINPDDKTARYNLALTHYYRKDFERSRKEYRTLLAIDPNIADGWHDLGLIDFEEGAWQGAVENFSKAVQLSPTWGNAWQGLGMALNELGRYPEAADAYTRCIDVDPNNAVCRQNLTIANRKAALSTPAAAAASTDACGDNQSAEEQALCFFQQAGAFGEKGLRSEQERAYKRCARANPRFAPCHYMLFELFKADRRDADAKKACQNFLTAATAEEFPSEYSACDRFLASGTF